MAGQVSRLKDLAEELLGKTPMKIRSIMGIANTNSDKEIWYYNFKNIWIASTKMILIFENGKVADIILQDFFLGFMINEISYSGSETITKNHDKI